MRPALACLLALVLLVCAAWSAPAPLPRTDRNPQPTTEQVSAFLRQRHHFQVESVQASGRWWVATCGLPLTFSPRRAGGGEFMRTVYLVKYAGKDEQDRPQFTVVSLEMAYLGYP